MTGPIIEAMAIAACKAGGDDWDREGPGGIDAYRDMAKAAYLTALPMIAGDFVNAIERVVQRDGHTELADVDDPVSAIRALAAAKVEELSRG